MAGAAFDWWRRVLIALSSSVSVAWRKGLLPVLWLIFLEIFLYSITNKFHLLFKDLLDFTNMYICYQNRHINCMDLLMGHAIVWSCSLSFARVRNCIQATLHFSPLIALVCKLHVRLPTSFLPWIPGEYCYLDMRQYIPDSFLKCRLSDSRGRLCCCTCKVLLVLPEIGSCHVHSPRCWGQLFDRRCFCFEGWTTNTILVSQDRKSVV